MNRNQNEGRNTEPQRDVDANEAPSDGMHRRDFLRLSFLAPLAALALRVDAQPTSAKRVSVGAGSQPTADGKPHRFELSQQEFLLDGSPFVIRSGGMHPIRIPREYWRHRIRMAKAMGLNTISLYVMWNALESEPGKFDLTTGRRDFRRFIHICQEEGMWVYLRPGPYICGEWDWGGLPTYLLRHRNIAVRTLQDPHYMAAVRRYIATLASVIRPLLAANGGPVLMVQIANEYASFGSELAYLETLRKLWRQHGVSGPFSIADGLPQLLARPGGHDYLPGAALGLDHDYKDSQFVRAQALAGEMPVWISEAYPGWLTHWGDKTFARKDFVPILRWLLKRNHSFNLYMAHGGTNFGFGAGANANDDYSRFEPVITSYDYGAPIDERGMPRHDYFMFRAMLAEHTGQSPIALPAPPPSAAFAPVMPEPFASVWDNLPTPAQIDRPEGNELLFGQGQGMVLYRRTVPPGGELDIDGVHDYALVFFDGKYVDYVSRVQNPKVRSGQALWLPGTHRGDSAILDILVDSFGHTNYGHAMIDRKGLVGAVRLDGKALFGWKVFSLPLDDAWIKGLKPLRGQPSRPGVLFRVNVRLESPGDCYLDMSKWDKGYVWVNGHLLGRYWNLGPQQRLFCPGPWWKSGDNEVIIFDVHRLAPVSLRSAVSLSDPA